MKTFLSRRVYKLRRLAVICFALFSISFFAQETDYDSFFSEDDLFGDFDPGIETIESSQTGTAQSAVGSFLKTEGVKIGGSISGSINPSWTWTDPWKTGFEFDDFDSRSLNTSVDSTLYFDARPNEDTKFYGSFKTSLPYESNSLSPNIRVFELFADRSYNDQLFFRFGKHTVKWGVGYFWSPADVINVTSINPLDPEAQREGPINLRLHVPIIGTQNNIWAYAIVPSGIQTQDLVPEDIAYAGKYEMLLGNTELGLGAFWQRDHAPKAMLTATGSVWRFNLFGEAVASWGSDKEFVTDVVTFKTEKNTKGLYFSCSVGGMYVDNTHKFNAIFQYFYNGEKGYSDSERKTLIKDGRDFVNLISNLPSGALPQGMTPDIASNMLRGLVYNAGLHYAGLSLSKNELFTKDLSVSVFAMASLSDLSGMVQPSISWKFFDGFSASFSPLFYWSTDALWGAGKDGEYVILSGGPSVSLSFKATLGSGKF